VFYQSRMGLKSLKYLMNLSYIQFCMHNQICGCGQRFLLIRTFENFPLAKGVRIVEVGLYSSERKCSGFLKVPPHWVQRHYVGVEYSVGWISLPILDIIRILREGWKCSMEEELYFLFLQDKLKMVHVYKFPSLLEHMKTIFTYRWW
jgi:hypothetical protein